MRNPAVGYGGRNAVFAAAVFWTCIIFSGSFAGATGAVVFSAKTPLIELRNFLSPYHAASSLASDASQWEIVTAANPSAHPVYRLLVAEDVLDAGLRLQPPSARPAIVQVATSDPDVAVEAAPDFGRHVYRVTIPAERTASLAIRLSHASKTPSVAAWDEAALVVHDKQLAVLDAAVGGLLLSALAITSGLAAMTGRATARWAAFTLLGLFVSRLDASGLFDDFGLINLDGPYGTSAALMSLSFAAGLNLANAIVPFGAQSWLRRATMALLGACLASYAGLPGAALVVWCAVAFGTMFIAVHVVRAARRGSRPSRAAIPAAIIFAAVAVLGGFAALGLLGNGTVGTNVIGGLSSAGAVLLAIIGAGEFAAGSDSSRELAQQPATAREKPSQAGLPSAAHAAIAASHQGIFELRIPNGPIALSPETAGLLGQDATPASFTLEDWVGRIHPDDREVFRAALKDFGTRTGLAFRIEFRFTCEDGRQVWLELRATTKAHDNAYLCLGLLADITMRREPASSPRVDALTDLPNRAVLNDDLETLGPGYASALLVLLDIDRFKSVHASLGDAGADAVLAASAGRLKEAFAPFGRVYRVGGDSFAVLFDAVAGNDNSMGEKVVQVLSEPINLHARSIYLSVSAGLARGGKTADVVDLYRNAELALFQAKRAGGSCARSYASDFAATDATDAVALEADLRRALANDDFEVFYQPIMRMSDGAVSGFEALLRWTHPVMGRVEPQRFIAHSEESGSILELGKLVLTQAAAELARWQRYFPLDPPLTVSVNLSRRQLRDAEFGALLTKVLASQNIRHGTLMLELTETALGAVDDARDYLMRLKSAGVGLSLDDFGTGLSALSQLKDLPFDAIKIDKSFLEQGEANANMAILRSIVQLARDLNLAVVAEGVETARDAQWLREIGCGFVQGYFFSPPLPRSDVLAFIARHHIGVGGVATTRSGVAGMGGKAGDIDSELS